MKTAPWIGAAIIATIAAAAALLAGRASPDVSTLKAALAAHATQTVRDTSRISMAVLAADTAHERQRAAMHRGRGLNAVAGTLGIRADSAHLVELHAASLADSVSALSLAYSMRTEQATTLHAVVAVADTALAWATSRGDSLNAALSISVTRAERADSVLAVVAQSAGAANGCRLIQILPCPTRRALGWLLVILVVGALRH